MLFIEYKGDNKALLSLNNSATALEQSLEGLWGTNSMVRSRSYNVDEDAFIKRLEQTSDTAKRKHIIHWQNGRRLDQAIIFIQLEGMVDRIAQCIEPAQRDCVEVFKKLQADIDANIDGEGIFWNNYVYTRSLICCATVLVNRIRQYLANEELRPICLNSLRKIYQQMDDLCLSMMLEDPDKTEVPGPGPFVGTCKITPLSVAHPQYEAMTAALAECWQTYRTADELAVGLITKAKGALNEKNYKKQFAEAAGDPAQQIWCTNLRRTQQIHRSNFTSCKLAAAYHNNRLQELLDDLCDRCNELRKQPLPQTETDRDRVFAACILVHWSVYLLFQWKRQIDSKIWGDPTNGEGHLHTVYENVLKEHREMSESETELDYARFMADNWQPGSALEFMQHFDGMQVQSIEDLRAKSDDESDEAE